MPRLLLVAMVLLAATLSIRAAEAPPAAPPEPPAAPDETPPEATSPDAGGPYIALLRTLAADTDPRIRAAVAGRSAAALVEEQPFGPDRMLRYRLSGAAGPQRRPAR